MSLLPKTLAAAATAALLAIPWAGTAGATTAVSPRFVLGPVAVTGTTPFPNCTAGGTPTSTVFPGAEVEPSIATNPRDPRNIVAYYQQDRWNDGGSHGLVASVTHDLGRHWKQVIVPGTSQCSGGVYERASDAGVSFAPNGDLYAITLAFDANDPNTAILVTKSTDGGDTWAPQTTLQADTDPNLSNDKELVTADPTSSRRAYAVWDRTNAQGGQPVLFTRTVNGGRSWEPTRIIYDPTPGFTIGNQIVVEPDGTLVDVFIQGPAGGGGDPDRPGFKPRVRPAQATDRQIRVIRSTDHGKTWSQPITVVDETPANIIDPNDHKPLRTGDIVPGIAVDHHNGKLYVVYQNADASQSKAAILLTSSRDGGRHWSTPLKVSKTPDSAPQGNGQAFTATVDVSDNGTVGVTYYDFRRNVPGTGGLADFWAVTCRGGSCARNADRWREQHVGGSFDVSLAPFADTRGYFLGDYLGLAHVGPVFVPAFTMTHPIRGNQQDEYVAAVIP